MATNVILNNMNNNQNNPQEVPQVKSVERLLVKLQDELYYNAYPSATKKPVYKEQDLQKDYFPLHMVKTVCERYSYDQKSRIAQLEAELSSRETQNSEFREVLEEVQSNYRCGHRVITGKISDMVEQALNSK